jgi:glycosyltransferase involved in cell wall biosynthesis
MRRVIACNSPYNEGGMGQFLSALVEEARSDRSLAAYYTVAAKPNDPLGREVMLDRHRWMFRATPLRFSHAWRDYVAADLFDRAVARELVAADVLVGFGGRTLRTFRRARELGYTRLVLESATSHIANVWRQHAAAAKAHPFEAGWLNLAQVRRTLREYEMADEIVVTSEYSRQSFLREGVPEAKLTRRVQPVAARFAPPPRRPARRGFRIVYVGRLQVTKGIPLLLDAFSQLRDSAAELVLVGGWATGAMERYVKRHLTNDPRVRVRPGDPLAELHQADVLVHPTYEDGLGLGPLEALAAGVPVIVTEDTGMKEYVVPGVNGLIVPTGRVDALVAAIESIRSKPLVGALVESHA